MKTPVILPLLIVSFLAFAKSFEDQKLYSSDFMNEVEEIELEYEVPTKPVVISRKSTEKKYPAIQRVDLNQKSEINGKWEIVRVLDKDLNPVYDKNYNYDDKNSEIYANFELLKKSTVRLNNDNGQIYNISLFNKRGTIAIFKPFENGYEILEARRVQDPTKIVASNKESVSSEKDKRTKIEKRFEVNQELTLVSALYPAKSNKVIDGLNVAGSLYLMGDQVSFDGVSMTIGKNDVDPLSFEADIDGNTGHLNYNNEIQGIVSLVGDKEVKVRFSTGPIAGSTLTFRIPSAADDSQNDNYFTESENEVREIASEDSSVEKEDEVEEEEEDEEIENAEKVSYQEKGEEFFEEDEFIEDEIREDSREIASDEEEFFEEDEIKENKISQEEFNDVSAEF